MNEIEQALNKVASIVRETGVENDITYFSFHRKRFRRMAETVTRVCQPGSLVLDIGSHYLHSSLLLTFLGYRVVPMDVEAFWQLDHIRQRAQAHGLTPIIENNLEKIPALAQQENVYDLVLFTEIFEHITFNPLLFWKRIYTIIKNNGIVYITTPNSLTLYGIVRTLANLVRFKGIGLGVNAIFDTVTYGHHWKEFSTKEISAYFRKMNDGFHVSMSKYHYQPYTPTDLKSRLRIGLINTGNRIPFFREAIEAVVRVDKSYDWKINMPDY